MHYAKSCATVVGLFIAFGICAVGIIIYLGTHTKPNYESQYFRDSQRLRVGMNYQELAETFPYFVRYESIPKPRLPVKNLVNQTNRLRTFRGYIYFQTSTSKELPYIRFIGGKVESISIRNADRKISTFLSKVGMGMAASDVVQQIVGLRAVYWEPDEENGDCSLAENPRRLKGFTGRLSATGGETPQQGYFRTELGMLNGIVTNHSTEWVSDID